MNAMAIKIEKLFPTYVGTGKLAGASTLNRRLLAEITEHSARDAMGRKWSEENYAGGYTSYASLSDMHHRSPAFSEFAEAMQPHADAYGHALGWRMRGLSLQMTGCWMNIMPRHVYHTLHLHPHSVLSGAYYVDSPKGSVAMKLEDPKMPLYMNAPVKREPLYRHITPTAGTYVLFESWLRHEVPPNKSTKARVSISFNYSLELDD
jgi:uncharacterized protein (TIGR02466 family)